jgi:peptidoglycan-associated lipoprotein
MRIILVTGLLLVLALSGCGVKKEFVQQQIQESESRTEAKLAGLTDKTNANADQIAKLQSLASQLSEKTDMAINEAKGFETYQVIWEGTINFDFDSYDVNATAEDILMEGCETMGQHPKSVMEIAGHTDRTGSANYNLLLGEKRANSAKRFLADHCGISLYRLFEVSYGKSKPVAMMDERGSASKNRRVTLRLWGNL